jgi:hypothetical protein
MKWVIAIVLLVLSSCQDPKRESSLSENNQPLSSELKSIIIDYQKKYPIPFRGERHDLYIYLVSFYKKASDTIVTVKRPADGLSSVGWDVVLGVYQDSLLLPTFIRDDSALYSKGLINKHILDSASRELFSPHIERDYSEGFPPVYQYRKKNGRLILDKIDTVWSKW